jgi:tRNA A-37 threonylcarbamoyl transferase component Bud32
VRSAEGTTQHPPEGLDGPDERPAERYGAEPTGEPARIGFIGKTLGRFHISAELGRGGMATVYRARDPQLGRDVAVKVMHGFFAGRAEIEARFRREATAVAAIRHPSILALYDFAPPAGEEPGYIVSELIDGPGLRRLVEDRGGRLLPEVSVLIAIRVAEALGAAHAAGIVHRDVKPDNVLIDRAGGAARVVLTDFGVAHVGGMDTMTATGAVLGSPAYMSPEQARGAEVGPPSDVFSLGVLLYQLCTGHLPFTGSDPLMVIAALLRGDYVRPGKIEAHVGPELEQIIARCLQRDATVRFPDGNAVAAALREQLVAAELVDEEAALRRYLADPDAFEGEVSPRISAAACEAAGRAQRRGHHPRALAEIGRALAYAPDDPVARDLLARIGSRSRGRWTRAGIAAAAAVAVVAVALVAIPRLSRPAKLDVVDLAHPDNSSGGVRPPTASPTPAAQTREAIAPMAAASGSQIVGGTTDPLINVPPLRAASATPPGRTTAPLLAALRQRRSGRGTVTRIAASAQVAATAPTPPETKGVAQTAATATAFDSKDPQQPGPGTLPVNMENNAAAPRPTADQPATARVVLRASHGFCEPSLDGHPPSLRASYDNLAAGPHEIFCTLPQGGGKVHVATYDLRPGTRPNLIIVPGPEGRPVLGRPE